MKKRQLGKTDMYVNPIGLGCMGFTRIWITARQANGYRNNKKSL